MSPEQQTMDQIIKTLRHQNKPAPSVDPERIRAATERMDARFSGEGTVKVLMRDGKWLVSAGERPKV